MSGALPRGGSNGHPRMVGPGGIREPVTFGLPPSEAALNLRILLLIVQVLGVDIELRARG
jgi:hypothetical protein